MLGLKWDNVMSASVADARMHLTGFKQGFNRPNKIQHFSPDIRLSYALDSKATMATSDLISGSPRVR